MKYITLFIFIFSALGVKAQDTIRGVVYDKGRINRVEFAKVINTNGQYTFTDSMGRYAIAATDDDSIYFSFNNRETQKFPVKKIYAPDQFDIALRITVNSRYTTLKEVVVYAKSFRQDSIENRREYEKVFNYKKPGLETSYVPGGGVGANLDELINMFRFKRNKRLKAFQQRLEEQERDKYVRYRFSPVMVQRTTGLKGALLDTFMLKYTPTYDFIAGVDDVVLTEYVLKAFEQFKRLGYMPAAKKEDEPSQK